MQELVGRIADRRVYTYGENPQADVRLMDVNLEGGVCRFNVLLRDRKTCLLYTSRVFIAKLRLGWRSRREPPSFWEQEDNAGASAKPLRAILRAGYIVTQTKGKAAVSYTHPRCV